MIGITRHCWAYTPPEWVGHEPRHDRAMTELRLVQGGEEVLVAARKTGVRPAMTGVRGVARVTQWA